MGSIFTLASERKESVGSVFPGVPGERDELLRRLYRQRRVRDDDLR
jgi:hypothetical protein